MIGCEKKENKELIALFQCYLKQITKLSTENISNHADYHSDYREDIDDAEGHTDYHVDKDGY